LQRDGSASQNAASKLTVEKDDPMEAVPQVRKRFGKLGGDPPDPPF